MFGAKAKMLPDGKRLHLHHGPIDLIVSAESRIDGMKSAAFEAAVQRFEVILEELVQELPILRTDIDKIKVRPQGAVAKRMYEAVKLFAGKKYITPMAAVAGSVAEEILDCMTKSAELERAFVNNGGDIAFHLTEGMSYQITLSDLHAKSLGKVEIYEDMRVCGVATSGRGGRSLSLGIADSVTVLGRTASVSDAAATLIANAVDLPSHPSVIRSPAKEIDDNSDLGKLLVVTDCDPLTKDDICNALDSGAKLANQMHCMGQIEAAALFLQGEMRLVGERTLISKSPERILGYA